VVFEQQHHGGGAPASSRLELVMWLCGLARLTSCLVSACGEKVCQMSSDGVALLLVDLSAGSVCRNVVGVPLAPRPEASWLSTSAGGCGTISNSQVRW